MSTPYKRNAKIFNSVRAINVYQSFLFGLYCSAFTCFRLGFLAESSSCNKEVKAFSPSYGLAPSPPPPRQFGRPATHRKTQKERRLLMGRWEWRGKKPNHTTARKPCRLLCIKYSMHLSIPGFHPA
jgi:hypothetical protein